MILYDCKEMGNLFSSTKIQYEDIPSPDNANKKEICTLPKTSFSEQGTNNKIRMATFCCGICERVYSKDTSNNIDTLA
jgi:hypothetical protein